MRKRPVDKVEKAKEDDAFFLKKEWANYIAQLHRNQMSQLQIALKSQEKALNELKKDNIDLYYKAIQVSYSKLLLNICYFEYKVVISFRLILN